MREIKFRVYGRVSKIMKYYNFLGFQNYGYSMEFEDDSNTGRFLDGEGFFTMQYTGRKDKNGKEIYEGDIVIFALKWRSVMGKVIYHKDGYFGVEMRIKQDTIIDMLYRMDDIEVVGNIHENEELLKQ